MNSQHSIPDLLASIHSPPDDPSFSTQVFTAIVKERKELQAKDGDNLRRVCAEEYNELSQRLDNTGIQESTSVRNVLRTRRLANLLFNDKGELNILLLPRVIAHMTAHLYSLGPQRHHDHIRQEHILKMLTLLKDSKELTQQLQRISKPYLHPLADQIIRDTLLLPLNTAITDAHARRAALSALLCYLRQSIGSCFATAPAIIVHDEQPELFMKDLYELLGTGQLKRTFNGIEYAVPLSSSWGAGDTRKTIILEQEPRTPKSEIWYSPGLIAALETTGIFPEDLPNQAKIHQARDLIREAFSEWNDSNPIVITTMEEILRRVIMRHLKITPQDLEAYESRPRDMIHSGLLMQPSAAGHGMGGKGEACANFNHILERAMCSFIALADNALLKSWEFTLASFSEIKSEFTRWNLYSSLGLGPNEPHGIGQCLFENIKQKLEIYNQKASEIQVEYEFAFAQIKQLEVRASHLGSDKEAQWIRAEHQSKLHEFYTLEDMRNAAHAKAGLFARLFDVLIDIYDRLFPKYFQEVYDPDLHEVSVGPYDDSPAGFRLLFKHGRANTSQWSKIKTPQEFIECLSKFFSFTESEVLGVEALESIQSDLSELITAVVNHIRTQDFLESAFHRMAIAHRTQPVDKPLENLHKIAMKPWAYISGGTLNTLLSTYYKRDQKPTEVARWVDNPVELLVFLVDTIKQVPYSTMDLYVKNPHKSMLIHSPTHAFLLKPGLSPFKEIWRSDNFTYTWIRDQFVTPMERAISDIHLDPEMIQFLIDMLVHSVPDNFKPYFKKVFSHMYGQMTPPELREYIIDRVEFERGLQFRGQGILSPDQVDRALFTLLPLFPRHQLNQRLQEIWALIPNISADMRARLNAAVDIVTDRYGDSRLISASSLQDICMSLLCLASEKTSSPINYTNHVSNAVQKLGFAMPRTIICADTNWVQDYFAFLVNPGTGVFDLWRVDAYGRDGAPMSSWKQWLNGSRKEPQWGLYPRPFEYTSGKQ